MTEKCLEVFTGYFLLVGMKMKQVLNCILCVIKKVLSLVNVIIYSVMTIFISCSSYSLSLLPGALSSSAPVP